MAVPAPTRAGPPEAPEPPPRTGLLRVAPVVALLGVVAALVGVGLVLRPLSTPTQDCGTALTFLLDGEPNQWVSVDDPPEGVTPEQARDNNEHPCQERAANQARPAAALAFGGTFVAFVAALSEIAVRNVGRRRQHRARSGQDPSGA